MTKNRQGSTHRGQSVPILDRLNALKAVRERVFAGSYEEALELTKTTKNPPAVIDYWRGICLTGLGVEHANEAKIWLKLALGRGYAGAIGTLAVAERLLGESREYLKELQPEDYANLDAFDRAALLREIGHAFEGDEELSIATAYFEQAWNTAKLGLHAKIQLPFIGQMLGFSWHKRGYDARALPILTEALKFTSRTRRVDLLYRRCLVNLELHNLEAVELDLAEMKMFIPSNPELPPVVVYTQARLARARGGDALPLALALFQNAGELGHQAGTEVAFFSEFGAVSVQLERGLVSTVLKNKLVYDTEIVEIGAEALMIGLQDLTNTPRLQAFTWLREALVLAWTFEAHAPSVAVQALEAFRALHHRREEGWALLTLAETHLFLNQGEPNPEVLEAMNQALEIAQELGAVVFVQELRLLPRVRAFLVDLEADSSLRELLV